MKNQNNTISKFSVIWIFLMIHSLSFATGKTYPSCKPEDYFPKKGEDFCPQLEGVTLPYCCPQPSLPALNCTYYKSKTVYKANVQRGCTNTDVALVLDLPKECVDSVQQDIVSTTLVFRGSSGANGGSCCVQTCPPTRVLNGETLNLQTAQSPVSCDSLSGYSSTDTAAKVAACKKDGQLTDCDNLNQDPNKYPPTCLAPPSIIVDPPTSEPSPGNTQSSPVSTPVVSVVDPGGTPSTPVVTDPAPTTQPSQPVITVPAEVKHSRDSY